MTLRGFVYSTKKKSNNMGKGGKTMYVKKALHIGKGLIFSKI